MSKVTELEKALTTLFRKGTEVGYTETEIDEFLENIDYHALLQAVWNKAETVYAYRADGKNALSLDYRSAELFKQRATLLYGEMALKYKVSYQQVRTWTLRFEEMGEAGLEDRRGKRKKDQKPRTELEKAQIEIEQLKHKLYLAEMERDLLKKLDEIERREAFRK